MDSRAAIARALYARLAYTTLYEKVVETSTSMTAPYGALVRVTGSGGGITISAPDFVSIAAAGTPKMAFDFGVTSDGGRVITISAPDGKTLNGQASITLPAVPGASAQVFLDLTSNNYVAILGGAGAFQAAPPTYTVKGPVAQYDITTTPTAIPNTSITTAAFSASQKAIVTYSATVRTDAGIQDDNTFRIFDGVVGATIDAFIQTCGNSGVDVNPEWNTVSWTLEVPGNGSPRTFGLGVSGTNAGAVCHLLAGTVRGVVAIVNG